NKHQPLFSIFLNKQSLFQLLIFSLFGMLLVQYSYMASINYGNAAVATLLQYIAPIYIILWFIFRRQGKFKLFDLLVIILKLSGMFLLLTNGSFSSLLVASSSIPLRFI